MADSFHAVSENEATSVRYVPASSTVASASAESAAERSPTMDADSLHSKEPSCRRRAVRMIVGLMRMPCAIAVAWAAERLRNAARDNVEASSAWRPPLQAG